MEPVTIALVSLASGMLGNLAQSLATDLAKHEFYGQLGKWAKSSTIADALHRAFTGIKPTASASAEPTVQETADLLRESQPFDAGTERSALEEISRQISRAAREQDGPDRETLLQVAEAFDGLSRMLGWFHEQESRRRIEATRWLDTTGNFRAWTSRPWFVDFDLATPWGRFLLLGLAAAWNFPKSFEEGEGFMLYLAHRFPAGPDGMVPASLRQRLRQFNRETGGETGAATPSATLSDNRRRLAAEIGLLTQEELPLIRRYVKLVALLENAAEQSRLPQEVVAAIDGGRTKRLSELLEHPGVQPLLSSADESLPTLYLDFLTGLAAIEEAFEGLEPYLAPDASLTPARLAELIDRLKRLKAVYVTKGGQPTSVIKAKLPLLLRELRARRLVSVEACFCNTPDSHVRRSLKRIYPGHFTQTKGFPSLNQQGVQYVEQRLAQRLGAEELARLRESPVHATYYEVLLVSALVYFAAPQEPFLYDIPWFLYNMAGAFQDHEEQPGASTAETATRRVPAASEEARRPRSLVDQIRSAVESGELPRLWTTQHLLECPALAAFTPNTLKTDPPNRSASPCGNEAGYHVKDKVSTSPYLRFAPANDKRMWFCLREHYRPQEDPAEFRGPLVTGTSP